MVHLGVAEAAKGLQARELALPCLLHAAPYRLRRLSAPLRGQFLIGDARHADVDVDAVEQRS